MNCPNCGNNINNYDKFCTYCGVKIEEATKEPDQTNITQNNPNNDGTISLVFGIIACVFSFIPIISIPLAIASLILGLNYKKVTNNKSAGPILSFVGIILTIIFIIIYIILFTFIINKIDYEYDNHYKYPITDKYNDYYNSIGEHF